MFVRKFVIIPHLQRIINSESIRTIRGHDRGRIRIPVSLTERKSHHKEQYSSDYLEDVEKANVGIGRTLRSRLEAFGKTIDHDFDEEFFDSEIALDDIHPSLQNLAGEITKKDQQKQFQAIKKKYFRSEKLPGMLTYIEKQQILHLNREDPDYYDADKLAEGFPASPEIIEKILKTQFVAYTVNQVLRHDEAVRKNWEAFEKGELKFNDELQKIYSSFTGRSHYVPKIKEIEKYIPPPPDFASQIPVKEFGGIITSSHKYKLEEEKRRKNVEIDEQGKFCYQSLSGSARIIDEETDSNTKYLHHHTLESFRNSIEGRKKTSEVDQVIVKCKPMKQLESHPSKNVNRAVEKSTPAASETSSTGVVSKNFDPFMIDKTKVVILQRIHIPRNLWKKDKLYRVRDCFYDDKGYFVYRVPGLEF